MARRQFVLAIGQRQLIVSHTQVNQPERRQVRRVVGVEAEPAARHIDLDLAGRKDERQRGERPQVAIDDVQRGEGADP